MGLKNWVCGVLWVSIAWSLPTDVAAKQLKAGELFTQSQIAYGRYVVCLLYTSPSPRDNR